MWLARHVTSRDRVGRVGHSTRILRSSHPVGLGNLPDPRVRVGRVNPIGLKLDPTITLVMKSKSRTKVKNNKTKNRKLMNELFVISKTYFIYFYCCFLLLIIQIIILEL